MSVFLSPVGGAGAQFFDNNGNPLTGGKLYTYLAGTTTPQVTYTTSAGNVAHANPIVLDAAGRVSSSNEIWLADNLIYKFVLKDSNDVLIATWDNVNGINDVNSTGVAFTGFKGQTGTVQDLADGDGADWIGFQQAEVNSTARSTQDKMRDVVSVKDFGAVGNGIINDTFAIQNAINTGKRVYFPAGTYLCNINIINRTILEGEGSTKTIIKPFNSTVAAITYAFIDAGWSYHSEIHGIGFQGINTKTGVGFTFGKTNPSDYVANDEFTRNVKFFGCYFSNLEKGVQFPFGNIGSEFYSCGFSANKYGIYTLDNRFGSAMHAGCKYFYAGEFNSNECAVYCFNSTDGFGAINFKNTIFEYNLIATYIVTSAGTFCPLSFNGVWFEGNGVLSSGAATVTVDNWTGTTRTDLVVNKRTHIFKGAFTQIAFNNSGIVCDINMESTNSVIDVLNCRVEISTGFSGGSCTIANPSSSTIRMHNAFSRGGFLKGDSQICIGSPQFTNPDISLGPAFSNNRWFLTNQRSSKIASYGPSRVMSAALATVATTGNGSFSLTGSVVSDGRIYASCNEFTRAAFANNQFTRLNSPDSLITTLTGWYVFTFDFKRIAGNPLVYVWDRSNAQLAISMAAPELNKWYTMAAIGYAAGGQTLFLDFGGGAVTETCTWRVSAYQIHYFQTIEQAQSFLISGAFTES